MPSALDLAIDEKVAELTAPGAMAATGLIEIDGRTLPMITTAPATLRDYFSHFCTAHGDETMLVSDDERLSYTQVHAAADRIAAALISRHGIAKGDRVGIAMRNATVWIAAYIGILRAGAIAVLINGWWQSEELEHAIRDTGTRLILADSQRADRIERARMDDVTVVRLDLEKPLADALAPLIDGAAETVELPALRPEDPATILFTSGSTGVSKGAVSCHRAVVQATFNFLVNSIALSEIASRDGTEAKYPHAMLLNLPLFHVTANVAMFLQSVAIGRRLILMRRWDALEAMRLIERERCTYFVGVPTMSWEIMNHPERARYDLTSLTDIGAGGASRPPEHVARLREAMPASFPLVGYGLTETNAVGAGNFRANYLAKPASIGRPTLPLVDLAILDDAGNHLHMREVGEVSIRSICNFSGYWNHPDATAAATTADGYFRTGDLGYLDEDGYVFLVDRKKDIIIRGGENVACLEVEAAIYTHPAVQETSVFGLPDARLGEIVAAALYLKPGHRLDSQGLHDWLQPHLAHYKLPERIFFADAPLPKLGTEKIDKRGLRVRFTAVASERVPSEA